MAESPFNRDDIDRILQGELSRLHRTKDIDKRKEIMKFIEKVEFYRKKVWGAVKE